MATAYLAKDVRHERKVALEVLRPELAATMASAIAPRHPFGFPIHYWARLIYTDQTSQ